MGEGEGTENVIGIFVNWKTEKFIYQDEINVCCEYIHTLFNCISFGMKLV